MASTGSTRMTSSMLVRAFAREEASGSTPAERLDGQDSRLSGNVDTLLHRRVRREVAHHE
jgi:hypothetical protein